MPSENVSTSSAVTGDRRARKREFRALWITRVTAACRMRGISYSRFINGLRNAAVALDRKMLSEIAISDPVCFDKLVDIARLHTGCRQRIVVAQRQHLPVLTVIHHRVAHHRTHLIHHRAEGNINVLRLAITGDAQGHGVANRQITDRAGHVRRFCHIRAVHSGDQITFLQASISGR